jgi:hypothetical protein
MLEDEIVALAGGPPRGMLRSASRRLWTSTAIRIATAMIVTC